MKHTTMAQYAVDNASLLFLARIKKNHTNTFRLSMTLKQPVCPNTLQTAVDRIYRRFPTIIAGFYPGFFRYLQVPAKEPPQVQPDPGLLHTMTKHEIRNCAYRVFYKENTVAIEAFHALTDGYGALVSFSTLVAEYLRLKYGIEIPVEKMLVNLQDSPASYETGDSYADYETGKPFLVPNKYAYQLPGEAPSVTGVRVSRQIIPTQTLLDAAHRLGVTMTTLLSSVMAASIMEVQHLHAKENPIKPVRIMVPIDLRRMFPSRTLRNFVLYALPTMEPADYGRPLNDLAHSFAEQLHTQFERARLAAIMAYNVRTQRSWFFRHIPLVIKCTAMRIAYRFFGEVNSSVTVTNLGNCQLPDIMRDYVDDIDVILTPRERSPYGCSIISYGGHVCINISRFSREPELEKVFFNKLYTVMER